MTKGDHNSRFFHAKASRRRARNRIVGLMDDSGTWKDTNEELVTIISNYFSGLYSLSLPTTQELEKVTKNVKARLSKQMVCYLKAKFTEVEVYKAVFDMHPLKAPGPDGLLAWFYQQFWGKIGSCITKCCLKILNDEGSVKDINNTIISLILKTQSPEWITDFRPISLCSVTYKIIAKAVSNRFRHTLSGVISEEQCAFIPMRVIFNNTIVGFECLHIIKRRKMKNALMALKLDMAKAFDKIEWDFVGRMMLSLGFPVGWVKLIIRCISSVSYSFMLNGENHGNITPSGGLR
ncbi:hypothetical protein LWI28_020151 [Acer negundo]|uniref:Reverse transcriptase domain-containing protein n=1 Tax=Acer negundo TaxID=4023 RepID=A0AAD5IRY1_ACENE|nr:hypothetical protein LWI28_020151 [Acer negundo]